MTGSLGVVGGPYPELAPLPTFWPFLLEFIPGVCLLGPTTLLTEHTRFLLSPQPLLTLITTWDF